MAASAAAAAAARPRDRSRSRSRERDRPEDQRSGPAAADDAVDVADTGSDFHPLNILEQELDDDIPSDPILNPLPQLRSNGADAYNKDRH
jgi:hypothetical protein